MVAHGTRASGGHVTTRTYLLIAAILTVITAIEFSAVYIDGLRSILVPLLLALSAVKFALVVMFFMHLKFDHRLLTAFFLCGLGIATATIIAVAAAMAYAQLN